jgi:hypothetical protein
MVARRAAGLIFVLDAAAVLMRASKFETTVVKRLAGNLTTFAVFVIAFAMLTDRAWLVHSKINGLTADCRFHSRVVVLKKPVNKIFCR